MPEPAAHGPSIEQRLARAIVDVPGVARLEPSLARAVRRLSLRVDSPDDAPDGVTVNSRADAVDVAVEISVAGPGTALATAVAVREAVLAQLSLASLRRGAVSVRVLSVEPAVVGHERDLEATSDDGRDAQQDPEGRVEPGLHPGG
ncbi:MAG: hypothetical protein ABI112_12595 [Terracoccus sp.]